MPTPAEAHALLAQAAQSASTTKAGASWPQVAGLLSLGAASSLALPAIAFVPVSLLAIPMVFMFVWIAASFVFMTVFTRATKRGFGKRWVISIILWGVLWALAIVGVTTWFVAATWFLVTACAALTLVTMVGAWIEARQ